jgi:hypothetical protein
VFSGWGQPPYPDRFIQGLENNKSACVSASSHDASNYAGVFRSRDLGAAWLTGKRRQLGHRADDQHHAHVDAFGWESAWQQSAPFERSGRLGADIAQTHGDDRF